MSLSRREFLKVGGLTAAAVGTAVLLPGCEQSETIPNLPVPANPFITLDGKPILDASEIQDPKVIDHHNNINGWLKNNIDNPNSIKEYENSINSNAEGTPYLKRVSIKTYSKNGSEPFSIVKIPRVENPNATEIKKTGRNALLISKGNLLLYIPEEKTEHSNGSVEYSADPDRGEVYKTIMKVPTYNEFGESTKDVKEVISIGRYNWMNQFEPVMLPASSEIIKGMEKALENKTFDIDTLPEIIGAVKAFNDLEIPATLPLNAYLKTLNALAAQSVGTNIANLPETASVIVPIIADPETSKTVENFIEKVANSEVRIPDKPIVIAYSEIIDTKDKDGNNVVSGRQRVVAYYPDGSQVTFFKGKFEPDNSTAYVFDQTEDQDPYTLIPKLQSLGIYPYPKDYVPAGLKVPDIDLPRGQIVDAKIVKAKHYWNPNTKSIEIGLPYSDYEKSHPNHNKPSNFQSNTNAPESIQKSTVRNVLLSGDRRVISASFAADMGWNVDGTLNDVDDICSKAGAKHLSMYGLTDYKNFTKTLTKGFAESDPELALLTDSKLRALQTGYGQSYKNWAVSLKTIPVVKIDTTGQPDIKYGDNTLLQGDIVPIELEPVSINLEEEKDKVYIIPPPEKFSNTTAYRQIIGYGIVPGDMNGVQIVTGEPLFGKPDKYFTQLIQAANQIFPIPGTPKVRLIRELLNNIKS